MLQLMVIAAHRFVVPPPCNAKHADTSYKKLTNRFLKENVRP